MFRTLAVKLTLAFLLVGLTGSILVAVIIQQRTRTAFNNFILSREQQNLAENLIYFYQMNGSWIGVADDLARIQTNIPFQPGGMRNPSPVGSPLTLVGSDQIIVYSNQSKDIGEKVSSRDLNGSVALQANGKTIGWLLLTPVRRTFTSNTPEGIFLRNVNSATLLSAIVAVLLALILGGLLAFTMTRSFKGSD